MMALLEYWPLVIVAAIWAGLLVIEGMQWSIRHRLRQQCVEEGHRWSLDMFNELVCLRCERRVR